MRLVAALVAGVARPSPRALSPQGCSWRTATGSTSRCSRPGSTSWPAPWVSALAPGLSRARDSRGRASFVVPSCARALLVSSVTKAIDAEATFSGEPRWLLTFSRPAGSPASGPPSGGLAGSTRQCACVPTPRQVGGAAAPPGAQRPRARDGAQPRGGGPGTAQADLAGALGAVPVCPFLAQLM